MAMTHIRKPCHVVVEMTIRHEEMLSVSAQEKPFESQGLRGKKRTFFKRKGSHKGDAAKKAKANLVCYKCDKKGHYANECRSGDGKVVVVKQNVMCFKCDQVGHYKNKCPEATKAENGKI